ncbi:MAG: hypothetical protein LBK52_01165, partial [Deltaproteobacteria bacterium]|nr:hypothetical protein [Deltaproteobacteria bacterium]
INFNFRPGVPLADYSPRTPEAVFRHDFADRNYTLPLAYQGRVLHRIELLRETGPGRFLFRVTDGFGRTVRFQPVLVRIDSNLVQILDPATLLSGNTFATDEQGEVAVLYRSSRSLTAKTTLQTSKGQGVFAIKLTQDVSPPPEDPSPPEDPPEDPDPAGSEYSLELLDSRSPDFSFRLKNLREESVPNHLVAASLENCPGPVYAYQSQNPQDSFTTGPEGSFGLTLNPRPGHPEADLALTPEGGRKKKFTLPLPHELSMSASRTELPYLAETETSVAFFFNGRPLPAGTEVSLTAPEGDFSGLTAQAQVNAEGQVLLPMLKALRSGTLTIRGEAAGYPAGTAGFAVIGTDELTLEADPLSLDFGVPADVTLTVRKNGSPLSAGESVTVTSGSGLSGVPSSGIVQSGGQLVLPQVTALSLEDQTLQVRNQTLLSNEVTLAVQAAGTLSAENQPQTLELDAETEVKLTVRLNARTLPAGTQVSLEPEEGLTGLPSSAQTGSGGSITLPKVIAVKKAPLNLKIGFHNLEASVSFSVLEAAPDELTLEASPLTLDFGVPADVTLTVRKNGSPLSAGESVSITSGSGLSGVPSSGIVQSGGQLVLPQVTALALEDQTLQVRNQGISSNIASLKIQSAGTLTAEPQPQILEFLTETAVSLTVRLNGEPLPAGTPVSLEAEEGLAGIAVQALTGPGGIISLPKVTAAASGPLTLTAQALNLEGTADFSVYADPGQLSLDASPSRLEFMTPENTDFTLSYRGQPLPAGLSAVLTEESGRLKNLPSGPLQSLGSLPAPGLEAGTPDGPLTVTALIEGFASQPQTELEVFVNPSRALSSPVIEPSLMSSYPELANLNQPLIASCQTFSLKLVLTYGGQPMAGTALRIKGFQYGLAGQEVTTDASGILESDIRYSIDDQAVYTAQSYYEVTLGGETVRYPGPMPLDFKSCNP